MNQPWSASGWLPIVNLSGRLTMTSSSPIESTALVNYDPDGNGRAGGLYFMAGAWSASGWQIIADNVSDAEVTTTAEGRRVVAAISDPNGDGAGVVYAMGWPWTASGWAPFSGPDVSEVELTAPVSGGTTGLARGGDPSNTGVGRLYFQHDPWSNSGWKPIADNVGKFAVTSPLWGGSIVAAISDADRDGIGDLWYQGTPWTADGWKVLANNVRDVSLGRDGNGQPRITMTSQDGTVYAQGYSGAPSRYPFTAGGFMRIAASDMKLRSVRISGNVISGLRTAAGGNTVATFQQDPLNETGWKDLANSTVGLELDDLAYKVQRAHNYWRYPTSVQYGGDNRTVDTDAEREAFTVDFEATDTAEEESGLWNGMSPSDQAGVDAYWERRVLSVSPTAEPVAVMETSSASTASSNADWPVPPPTSSEARVKHVAGGCGVNRPVEVTFIPFAPLAARSVLKVFQKIDFNTGKRIPSYDKGGNTYVPLLIETRQLRQAEAIWSAAAGSAPDADGNASFPLKTSAERDASGNRKPKPWYYHQTLKVRAGTRVYFRGRTRFQRQLIARDTYWYGDRFPASAYDWLSCTVVA